MPIKLYISQASQLHNAGPGGYTERAGMIAISRALGRRFARDPRFIVKRSPDSGVDRATENSDAANAWHADYYVALHSNAGMRGTVVFHHSASGKGKALAQAIYAAIAPLSPGAETGTRVQTRDGFIEIHRPNAPAVLVELEAHDYTGGVAWLTGKRAAIAQALYVGTCRGIGLEPLKLDPFITVRVRRSVWAAFRRWRER